MFQRQVASQTLRGEHALGWHYTARSPKHHTKIDCTVSFSRINNGGTFISCATPKTCCQGVHLKMRNTVPLHTRGRVLAQVCVQGGFSGGIPDSSGGWGPWFSALKCRFQSLLWSFEIRISTLRVCFFQLPKHKTHSDISSRQVAE